MFAVLVLSFSSSGCGTGEGSPPVLSDLRYGGKTYVVGFNEGEAGLTGFVRFEDPDGDLFVLRVEWQYCGQGEIKRLDIYRPEQVYETSGRIFFTILISTDCALGTYEVDISAVDGQGHWSNHLVATYEIVPEPEASTGPGDERVHGT